MSVNHHPDPKLKPELTQADLDAWPNCPVPGCTNKVTWDSDKCFPHTHGWEAVRNNVRERLAIAEQDTKHRNSPKNHEEIAWCKAKLEEIKDFQ